MILHNSLWKKHLASVGDVEKENIPMMRALWHTCPRVAIFAIKKAKTAKDVLDKKAPAAGTPVAATLALWFLRAEKQRQVPATRVTIFTSGKAKTVSQVHAALHILSKKTGTYNRPGFCALYVCWINRYWLQVHSALHIFGEKTGICNRPGLRYIPGFIFLVRKQITATG